jgi:signal transduction histidine kinase
MARASVPPLPTVESTVHKARALVSDLAARCHADAVVLLGREEDNWRILAVAGPGVRRLKTGDLFSTAQNPSLSPEFNAQRPPLSSEAEPFLAALGPVALGDWISCPVVTAGRPVGLLHLLTRWSNPFSSDDVDAAVLAAHVASGLIAGPEGTEAAPSPETGLRDGLAQVVSLLHHDLRSPLNAVLGFAEMLSQGDCDPDQVVRYAGIIARGGEALQEMVDRVVVHMRILLGTHPWRPERLPLGAVLSGFPAAGDLEREVLWDPAVADACQALLETVTTLGGEQTLHVGCSDDGTGVCLTFGAPGAEARPLDGRFGGISAQYARQVFAAHGGTVSVGADGAGFTVRLPAEPPGFAAL